MRPPFRLYGYGKPRPAVNPDLPSRHPVEGHRSVAHLVERGLGGRPKRR